jgi:hypothetical protein
MKTILMGPPGFPMKSPSGLNRVTAFGTIMRRILFPQSKYVKQFSDLRDKSLDPEETYLKLTPLSVGFYRALRNLGKMYSLSARGCGSQIS